MSKLKIYEFIIMFAEHDEYKTKIDYILEKIEAFGVTKIEKLYDANHELAYYINHNHHARFIIHGLEILDSNIVRKVFALISELTRSEYILRGLLLAVKDHFYFKYVIDKDKNENSKSRKMIDNDGDSDDLTDTTMNTADINNESR